VPGFANARIAATATQIGIRESRRIVGEYTLTADDVLNARTFPDAVARSAYPIDIHNPVRHRNGDAAARRRRAYEIPYRCLVPLFVERSAGRRALHFDDARSAGVDALDADGDDARASRRHRGRALGRRRRFPARHRDGPPTGAADRRRRRLIRVNARVFDRPNAGVANGALEHAIAHELYHHREAIGEIARLPERRARERAADAFAEACAGAR
jgi:hypothetical protein